MEETSPDPEQKKGVLKKTSIKFYDLLEFLEEENPYPEDIFPTLTSQEWEQIEMALKNADISPNQVFGNWGRRVWETCIESLKEFSDDQ